MSVGAQRPRSRSPAAGRPVTRPELVVPHHALPVSLPLRVAPDELVAEWLRLEPALLPHAAMLTGLVLTATAEPEPGEVAAFLMYEEVGGCLVGGTALLSLELVEPMLGPPSIRADLITARLREAARSLGHVEGLTQLGRRRTASGVPSTRVRFLTTLFPAWDVGDVGCSPMVEVCRWLYPVPTHRDLAWSLAFHTPDLDHAEMLVAGFDAMASSLRWAGS